MKLNTIVIIAILLRILLIPFFYHPDMKSQYFHFQFLSQGKLNIYQYIYENRQKLPYLDNFNYLPLTYFTFGSVNTILSPIMPNDFKLWINDWGNNQNNYSNMPYYLLILKIPYLILDILIGYILFKLTKSKSVQIFWLFNPISFYLIYVLGNFDILPVFLTLYSFYIQKSNTKISLIIFGIAIALKLYPIIFLPFFLFNISKRPLELIKNFILTLLPPVITLLPFISNSYFWQSFLGSGLTQKILELKYKNIPVFPVIYIIILFRSYIYKSRLSRDMLYIFLLFISCVNFHPQWILWFYPFLLLQTKNYSKYILFLFTIITILAIFYIILFNDNYLFWGHLIPIDSQFINVTSPYEIARYKFLINPQLIQSQIKLCITICSIVLLKLYENNSSNNN